MSFNRPSLKELHERVSNDISSELGISKPLKRSVVYAVAFAIAGVAHLLYGFIDWIYKQIFVDTADNDNVIRISTSNGVPRKQASYAQREVKYLGTNGKVIPLGTILIRDDGTQYRTVYDSTITSGEATGLIIALDPGSAPNIAVGETLSFQSVISGVQGQVTILSSNLINGINQESVEELLERYLDKQRQPPHGGNENDYKQWSKEVPGVTRAFVYPARMGLSTVGISFLMDNEEEIIPNEAKVQEVQDYLNSLRPVTSEIWVFAPEAQLIDFVINLSPNTESLRTEVENEIRDLFKREAEPDKSIPLSKIREAISIANGEEDHLLVEPSITSTPAAGKILVPGGFVFHDL